MRLSRRALLSAAGTLTAGAAVGCATERQSAPPVVRGADLSFTTQVEASGRVFTDLELSAPVERLLAARGSNLVRLRLWVDPPSGNNDLVTTLGLARRAVAANCAVLLDLHYSDTWADYANQRIPAAWTGQDVTELADTVRRYTREVVSAFSAQGTPLAMVQIGNEVSDGMLWPVGQIGNGGNFVRLLKAGLEGARAAQTPGLRTIVHTDRGGDLAGCHRYFATLARFAVDFDVIGLSYYPFWHGALDGLSRNMNSLARHFRRDVLVVESAYPWTFDPIPGVRYVAAGPEQLPDGARFPATPDGQASYFRELRTITEGVAGGHGLGFVVWEPAWTANVPADEGQSNAFANLALFDWEGRGLPALRVFEP
ncbi:glycoside hydrolase family 53 protein [Pseudonocardia saturnea]